MPLGRSIHVGLDAVNPDHYHNRWHGKLRAAESDAAVMQTLAEACGFDAVPLLGPLATAGVVMTALRDAALDLRADDILMLSFAGHGAQVPDRDHDEHDQLDEAWCLFDRMVLDDELTEVFAEFAPGVRILVICDSCHSGTILQQTLYERIRTAPEVRDLVDLPNEDYIAYRSAPPEIANATYLEHMETYGRIQATQFFRRPRSRFVTATMLQLSACQDNQVAAEGLTLGYFTRALRNTWASGAFVGDYDQFHKTISRRLPPNQSPSLLTVGPGDADFVEQRPFSIE